MCHFVRLSKAIGVCPQVCQEELSLQLDLIDHVERHIAGAETTKIQLSSDIGGKLNDLQILHQLDQIYNSYLAQAEAMLYKKQASLNELKGCEQKQNQTYEMGIKRLHSIKLDLQVSKNKMRMLQASMDIDEAFVRQQLTQYVEEIAKIESLRRVVMRIQTSKDTIEKKMKATRRDIHQMALMADESRERKSRMEKQVMEERKIFSELHAIASCSARDAEYKAKNILFIESIRRGLARSALQSQKACLRALVDTQTPFQISEGEQDTERMLTLGLQYAICTMQDIYETELKKGEYIQNKVESTKRCLRKYEKLSKDNEKRKVSWCMISIINTCDLSSNMNLFVRAGSLNYFILIKVYRATTVSIRRMRRYSTTKFIQKSVGHPTPHHPLASPKTKIPRH